MKGYISNNHLRPNVEMSESGGKIFANFIFLLLMASIVEGLNLSKYKVIEVLNIKGSELNYLSLPFMPFIRYGNYFNEMIVSSPSVLTSIT